MFGGDFSSVVGRGRLSHGRRKMAQLQAVLTELQGLDGANYC